MRNHYYTPYVGNKRSEIKDTLPLINLENITTIIEPFAGSSAMSYYISTIYPNQYKYILNDNDKINYELYKISKDPARTQLFNENINKIITEWNTYRDDILRKDFYKNLNINDIEVYVFKTKYNSFRRGVYPSFLSRDANRFINIKPYKLQDYPIYDFYNNEDVSYENIDAIDFIEKYYEGDDKLFLLDPPYLKSCNNYYNNFNLNIYEWIITNQTSLLESKNNFILILENIKEVKEIFKDFKVVLEYTKNYFMSRKKTTHITYSN
jgi:hypothetical protein